VQSMRSNMMPPERASTSARDTIGRIWGILKEVWKSPMRKVKSKMSKMRPKDLMKLRRRRGRHDSQMIRRLKGNWRRCKREVELMVNTGR